MALVTIALKNDLPVPMPIEGVVVSFYDLSAVFQTSNPTDEDGESSVELPDGSYDVCFHKPGVSILPKQPQRIIVSSLLSNTFSVSAHERTAPESNDPRLCTVSGYILGIDGKKAKSRLTFSLVKGLTVIQSQIIELLSRLEVESDDTGYFQFDLLRGQSYNGYFLYLESFLDIVPPACVEVIVPDRPSVDLSRLLFPVPVSVQFSETVKTLSIADGNDESLTIDTVWSDGSSRWNSYAWAGLKMVNSDNKVAEFEVSCGKIVVKPLMPGVTTLTVERVIPDTVVFDPIDAFLPDTLTVTVVS